MQSSLSLVVILSFLAILILASIALTVGYQYVGDYNHNQRAKGLDSKYPEVGLPSSKEVIFRGLKYPTSMAFLGPHDILVTEKETGILRRIVNGTILPRPLLDVNVSTFAHRGMLGIAVSYYHLPTSDLANIRRNNGTPLKLQHMTVMMSQTENSLLQRQTNHKLPPILLKNEFKKEKRFVLNSTELLVEVKN